MFFMIPAPADGSALPAGAGHLPPLAGQILDLSS